MHEPRLRVAWARWYPLIPWPPGLSVLRNRQASAAGILPATSAAATLGHGYPRWSATVGPAGSQRELEVLKLIANGATNREAAAQLFVSEATIKTHLLHIYAKLGVGDRAAAVGEAYRRSLLT